MAEISFLRTVGDATPASMPEDTLAVRLVRSVSIAEKRPCDPILCLDRDCHCRGVACAVLGELIAARTPPEKLWSDVLAAMRAIDRREA